MSEEKFLSEKEKKIKKEIQKLQKIFKNIDADRKQVIQRQIENVAFMSVSLDELQKIINEKGYVETYQNGQNQSGVKETSEVRIYNTILKNFNSSLKQLIDLLPEQEVQQQADEFDNFLKNKP